MVSVLVSWRWASRRRYRGVTPASRAASAIDSSSSGGPRAAISSGAVPAWRAASQRDSSVSVTHRSPAGSMIGTRYEPSGCAGRPAGAGSSRDSATVVPTSSIVWICLAGRPSTAAASVGSYRASPAGLRRVSAPTPSLGRRPAEPWAPTSRAPVAGSRPARTLARSASVTSPGEAQRLSAPAPPATGFLAAIGVVAGRARLTTAGARTAGCGGLDGAGGQVADDGVDDLGHRPAGASQRRDGEPHRVTLGGRPAGAPQGHLQGCARWVCGSGTTVGDPRGTRAGRRRGTGGRVMVGGRGRG